MKFGYVLLKRELATTPTEVGHGREHPAQPGLRVLPRRGHPLQPNRLVKPTPTRAGLVPSTRFAPSGAAYRGR